MKCDVDDCDFQNIPPTPNCAEHQLQVQCISDDCEQILPQYMMVGEHQNHCVDCWLPDEVVPCKTARQVAEELGNFLLEER